MSCRNHPMIVIQTYIRKMLQAGLPMNFWEEWFHKYLVKRKPQVKSERLSKTKNKNFLSVDDWWPRLWASELRGTMTWWISCSCEDTLVRTGTSVGGGWICLLCQSLSNKYYLAKPCMLVRCVIKESVHLLTKIKVKQVQTMSRF